MQAKAIENLRKRSATVEAGHRQEGGGTKPADDEIQGHEYYTDQIQAIEAADISMFWSAARVLFQ